MKPQHMVSFDTSREDAALIWEITERAMRVAKKAGIAYSVRECSMDLTAAHCNGTPLRLKQLLEAEGFDFSHDIFGIRRHIDRHTGELGGCFGAQVCVRAMTPNYFGEALQAWSVVGVGIGE